jgi:hypothetical protein
MKLKKLVRAKKIVRLSRGVVRSLVKIYIDDISAVLRATDLRFRLPFVSWAELMHLILRILKTLEQTQLNVERQFLKKLFLVKSGHF